MRQDRAPAGGDVVEGLPACASSRSGELPGMAHLPCLERPNLVAEVVLTAIGLAA